ncbi:MAG: SPOR domain-containing protein [Synergistales bacterium]|nr:SPOR domain-containing protein [Synergistales bacterium]MDY6404729.1 SPOR domain-containing protein [Synergistales bacterium]MDY6409935.1 SPOR domain-containing protein [Synergistales bacterium]MDY6414487.1 SPOR domain-containing protein [Synergistales bacterium]MDY6422363.1 SPOR domain-containing protein [Synergistales bacterium]
MTSQHFSERTERTEHRRPTVRRGIKKRGVLPSFGDIILPVVGFSAVILLVIFGRQFFLNGLKSSPGISSTRAYAEAPAIIAELERKAEPEAVVKIPEPVSDEVSQAKPEDNPEEDLFALAVAVQNPKRETAVSVQPKAKISPTASKKTATAKSSSNATVKKSAAKTQTRSSGSGSVSSKQWRVQVGAYTSKAGAQEAANKIKKAGYSAIVYSNPASKHFKVWVQGGASKKAADNVVKAMQRLGYKGSFSFPPAK